MDTDDLTDLAHAIIVGAANVSDTLRVDLGAMASQFASEAADDAADDVLATPLDQRGAPPW